MRRQVGIGLGERRAVLGWIALLSSLKGCSVTEAIMSGKEMSCSVGWAWPSRLNDLRGFDGPGLDRVVGIDDVDIGATWTLPYSRCSDSQAIMSSIGLFN
jgi:hypothetical protein